MTNPNYDFWRARLAGDMSPATNEMPMCGFWRVRERKGSAFVPLAIFEQPGGIVGWLGRHLSGQLINGERLNDLWVHANANAVSEATYRAVAERGEGWPDQDAAVAAMGHNSNAVSDAEQIKSQIESAAVGAKDYAEIKDDEHQKRAQTLRDRLLELRDNADLARETEKKPFLEGGRAVDAKWKPLVDMAQNAAGIIRNSMKAWENVKFNAEQAALAEREKLIAAGVRIPENAPIPPPAAKKIKGASGRAASVRTIDVVVITDINKVFAQFKSHSDVATVLHKLAKEAHANGIKVDGVEIKQERDVR